MNDLIIPDRLAALSAGQVRLDQGEHESYDDGHCSMEVVAWLAGEDHTDAPACASLVLRGYVITLDDRWNSEQRQRLAPYLPRLVGTARDGLDAARERVAMRWTLDLVEPWLRLAGLTEQADQIEGLRDQPAHAVSEALWSWCEVAWSTHRAARERLRMRVREEITKRGSPLPLPITPPMSLLSLLPLPMPILLPLLPLPMPMLPPLALPLPWQLPSPLPPPLPLSLPMSMSMPSPLPPPMATTRLRIRPRVTTTATTRSRSPRRSRTSREVSRTVRSNCSTH